jgi:fructose-1-phosphate kinase PfkB-like protein
VIGGAGTSVAEVLANIPTPATGIYHLGSSWPTLIEEHTDPTEGIRTILTKKIVPARTPLLLASPSRSLSTSIVRFRS